MFISKKMAGVLAGAAYGLLLRVGFASSQVYPAIGTVSVAFLLVCPFCVGAVAVLWGAEKDARIPLRRQLGMALSAMALFLLAMAATLLEGSICLVLVAPVFLVAATIGGLIGGLVHNHGRFGRGAAPALALLPLLAGPVEAMLPPQSSVQSVTDSIHIAAPPEAVFDRLASVRAIQPEELGFSLMHVVGLPRPVEARMHGSGPGSVRLSRWERGVWFQEVMTEWDRPRAMQYRFVVPPGAIPRQALDEHVEINGEYFGLIDGGYVLRPAADGGTELRLTTRFVNKSRMKVYGNLWGKLVLKDFHHAILVLIKSRTERAA